MLFVLSFVAHKKRFFWRKKSFLYNYFSTVSFDSFFRLWRQDLKKQTNKRYIGHIGTVIDVCGSSNLNLLVSCSKDNSLKFWESLSGRSLKTIKFNTDSPQLVKLKFDYRILVSVHKKTISIWNVTAGSCVHSFFLVFAKNPSLCFINKSDIFCVSGNPSKVGFYNMRNGSHLKEIDFLTKSSFMQFNNFFSLTFFWREFTIYVKIDNLGNLSTINQFEDKKFPKNYSFISIESEIFQDYPNIFYINSIINKDYNISSDQKNGLILSKVSAQYFGEKIF